MGVNELLLEAGMEDIDPGYFAGRGATRSDLNSKILNNCADLIKENHGQSAHDSFVKMVWEMKTLSASAFLTNVFLLNRSNWDLSKTQITEQDDQISNEAQGFALLANALCGGPQRNDTEIIRSGFRKK